MIPYRLNPLGLSGAKGILGYAPDAEAFWDGLNNQGLGQHDTSATSWADLSGNGNTLTKAFSNASPVIWADDAGITGNGTAVARGLINNNALLSNNFTVETCLRKPNKEFSAWWWNNRNPWTTPAPFGFQCSTYSSLTVGLEAYNNESTCFVSLGETTSEKTPAFETVTYSYDGTTLKMYRSGVLFAYADVHIPTELIMNTPFLVNGSINNSAVLSLRYTDSRLYAIRVYHRSLSQAEISKNYQLDQQRFNV